MHLVSRVHPTLGGEPLSGAGAARSGGRFNRFGQPALYLSLHLDTAAAEYAQAAPFLPPFTLVSYRADLPALADVRLLDASWDALWADWTDDWRKALVNKVEPVSWVLGDLLREAAIPGVIFPSMAQPGGVNVALFWTCCSPSRCCTCSTMAGCRVMGAAGQIRQRNVPRNKPALGPPADRHRVRNRSCIVRRHEHGVARPSISAIRHCRTARRRFAETRHCMQCAMP